MIADALATQWPVSEKSEPKDNAGAKWYAFLTRWLD